MTKKTGDSFLTEADFNEVITGKSVFYMATTYTDYLRVQQEIKMIEARARICKVVVFDDKRYFSRLFKLYFFLLFHRFSRYDVVFLGFSPQLILPFWWFKFKGAVVVSDFFISFYDTLVNERQKFSANSSVASFLKWLDRSTVEKSHKLVADTKAHAEYFRDCYGADVSNSYVLYLEADRKYYHRRTQVKPDFLRDKFVVLYFGSVIPLQGVDVVVDSVSLSINNRGIHFVMIGPLLFEYKEKLKKNKNATCFDWLNQNELSYWISVSDLCLAGHFNSEIDKAKRTIPGKAYIYEAMNKRMILGDNRANRERYPEKYNAVRFVPMGSSALLFESICDEFERWKNG